MSGRFAVFNGTGSRSRARWPRATAAIGPDGFPKGAVPAAVSGNAGKCRRATVFSACREGRWAPAFSRGLRNRAAPWPPSPPRSSSDDGRHPLAAPEPRNRARLAVREAREGRPRDARETPEPAIGPSQARGGGYGGASGGGRGSDRVTPQGSPAAPGEGREAIQPRRRPKVRNDARGVRRRVAGGMSDEILEARRPTVSTRAFGKGTWPVRSATVRDGPRQGRSVPEVVA